MVFYRGSKGNSKLEEGVLWVGTDARQLTNGDWSPSAKEGRRKASH